MDLTLRPNEDGLSVYRVLDCDADAREIALLFGMMKDRPDNVDYLIIEDKEFEKFGLKVSHTPLEDLPEKLSGRHYEILGVSAPMAKRLAAHLLSRNDCSPRRIRRSELDREVKELIKSQPTLAQYLGKGWKTE